MENRELSIETINRLMNEAKQAQKRAYAPYSRFFVGSALLTAEGKIYTGCNIENASYPVGLCAERTAFASAVSNGERNFVALALVGGEDISKPCFPCGMCRQFMREFCSPDFQVIVQNNGKTEIHAMRDLLPDSFSLS